MRRGFTLVELLISFTILAVISGGALVYLNNFNARQNLDKASDEVISSLRLAHSYAKTRQLPLGSQEAELRYVQVQVIGSNLVARANGVGETYFDIAVNSSEIGVSTIPQTIYFWGGNGFLSSDSDGTMYGIGDTVGIIIQLQSNIVGYNLVVIDALGQVRLIGYNEGVILGQMPTTTPTVLTATPTPIIACRLGGVSCSVHGDCCSYYCSGGACTVPAPTPTPISCKLGGVSCSVHGDCCSYYCSTLHFCN
jgi:prepilin-type N-terminal cleavage/methylation domain-containing protein